MSHFLVLTSHYFSEIVFGTVSLTILMSLRLRKPKLKPSSETNSESELNPNSKPKPNPKLYIQLRDVIIDTHSDRKLGIDFMEPIGHVMKSIRILKDHYKIILVYHEYDEICWADRFFKNHFSIEHNDDIKPNSNDIVINTKNFTHWPVLTRELVTKANNLKKEIKTN